jgi:DNA-binding NtrC family response regulator
VAQLLVVDDNEDIAGLVQVLLESEGHKVRVAANGEEGLAALEERYPEVVLLDIEMPVLDGPSMVYRMFVENLGRENIPVVLMSGVPDLPRVAKRVGTPYAIAKPFDADRLMALVRQALAEHQVPRPAL